MTIKSKGKTILQWFSFKFVKIHTDFMVSFIRVLFLSLTMSLFSLKRRTFAVLNHLLSYEKKEQKNLIK